jgi:predicted MFS family arabinose efflux permease
MTMTTNTTQEALEVGLHDEPTPTWSAVYAISLCTFVLIASEFLPMSLLSPIARDLGLIEGQTGQAISVSGIFAVVASLSFAPIVRRLDRRHVLIFLTLLLAVSALVVASASVFPMFLLGRALLVFRSAASGGCRLRVSCGSFLSGLCRMRSA